jgi:hypothetical protein
MYSKIKRWYMLNLWTKDMVSQAVGKGVLTQAQADTILEEK